LFFLSHNEDETSLADSASKVNEHEAKIAAKLSFYLIQQGYECKDITIITMYAGQKSILKRYLREERKALTEDMDKIQISSVDGYQGEENKIIILSLVRSNTSGQIGFLKAANRVCVALSRAKHGMYILGNANLLCDKSELWNEIVVNLEERPVKMIGTRLPLKCAKHEVITQIQWAVDFVEVEEGGCSKPCKELLECGHECDLRCHPYDHSEVQCKQPCGKILECRHVCVRRCYERCGPCPYQISVRLPCGHLMENECDKIRSMARAPAGHRCPTCNAPLKQQ
ncbi:AAA domain-containing protein, partial [Sporodiniella umbellata]